MFLNSVLDSLGRQVTHTPYLNGTISSETGYENVRVEYEVTQGGTDSGVAGVDPYGKFCWKPQLTTPTSDATISVRVRSGQYDPNTDTTTWGAWSTKSFVYQAPSETVLLGWKKSSSTRLRSMNLERCLTNDSPEETCHILYLDFTIGKNWKFSVKIKRRFIQNNVYVLSNERKTKMFRQSQTR
ncbi:MAG: hypothetical protein J6X44_11295 [Thermoguttaceae bacterium]|nr:hypothetical protein [Thermoguttaceae bacterium]